MHPDRPEHLDDWSPTPGTEPSPVIGPLVALLVVGVLLLLVGGRHLLEVWTEDCLVGTEYQRCTQGQGRVVVGVGMTITVASAAALAVVSMRRRMRRR